ncbi:hypothetical protein LRY65_00675 [Candidatus Woesebacteria bacterium]|nr:hypothetical protein [Candidatus Woesebacteria bacterium]MCD8526713.1 hypothetical protein [Candidatus Woesebacteria bacterium]MCD8546543.1 hypothetical protein [Candidatus Woesebacteria bacterium]
MNWTHILRVFIVGWGILLVAVVINVLAQSLGVMTWYVWLKQVTGGTYALSVYDAVFLWLVYPLSLGVAGFGGWKMVQR